MSTFRLEPNGTIYLYHWITPKQPFKASTRLKIEPKKWNATKMRPKSPSYTYKGVNVTKELIRIEGVFHSSWNYFQINGGFSPIKLRHKFKELLKEESGISATNGKPRFLDFFLETLEGYKITMKRNSWKGYNTTLQHLNKFFGRSIPNFEDIDRSFYAKYNQYLDGKNLSTNSKSSHWKHIKAIMRRAHMLSLHENTKYQFFTRHNEESDSVFLDIDELKKIFELELTGYKDKVRDYFLIGCYTGLRYSDWDKLTKNKIKNDQAIIRSSKTDRKSTIPIANNVLRIFAKYPKGVLPKKPPNQKMNEYIKKIAKLADIDEQIEIRITKGGTKIIENKPKYSQISTHTARRSYATNMILNGVQPHLIMKITGHKSLSSFEKYIRFDELQASIQLKESGSFKDAFGEALTWSEKIKTDPEFRKKQTILLLP